MYFNNILGLAISCPTNIVEAEVKNKSRIVSSLLKLLIYYFPARHYKWAPINLSLKYIVQEIRILKYLPS